MPYIESRFRSLYITMLINFVIFGITMTVIGATLPRIIEDFEWSYIATGIVLSAGSVGYFCSTFVSGILLQKLGPKLLIAAGLSLQALGLSLFAVRSDVLANLILILMVGLGQGATEVVVNFGVVRMERNGQSRLMNLMHAAFAVGGVIGPLATGIFISVWRMAYRTMAMASFIIAFTFLFLPFSRLGGEEQETEEESKAAGLLRRPLLILCFLILLIYVGTELGVSSWVAEYYVGILGSSWTAEYAVKIPLMQRYGRITLTSASVGAYMVSIFWLGLLIGRLSISGYRGYRQAELMLILACTCTISLLYAVLMKIPFLAGIGFFLAGLGYSAIYPLVIAVVGHHIKRGQGAAIGYVSTGGGIGSFTFQLLMGTISQIFGIKRGFFFYIALDVVMILLACLVVKRVRVIQKREVIPISIRNDTYSTSDHPHPNLPPSRGKGF